MKLYLIGASSCGYDTYDSAVVAARSAKAARHTHPGGGEDWSVQTWVGSPDDVVAVYIGEAKPGTLAGVIVASFNAG